MSLLDLSASGEYTIAEYNTLPEGHRYELIGGSIIVNPSPLHVHQRVSFRLGLHLERSRPADHEVLAAPIDLLIDDLNQPQPDLMIAPRKSARRRGVALPVLLVVELISASSVGKDQLLKRDLYASNGIPHYWLVDTRDGLHRFTAMALSGQDYEVVTDSTKRLDIEAPVELHLDLDELF